jgi:hypothetical protein
LRELSNDKEGDVKSNAAFGIYFMLIGLCMENLFKAALVRETRDALEEEFQRTKELPKELNGHDLYAFAKKIRKAQSENEQREKAQMPNVKRRARQVEFTIVIGDEELLRRLSRAVIWAGRYPIPRQCRDMANGKKFSDGKVWSNAHFAGDDVQRLRGLVSTVRSKLNV